MSKSGETIRFDRHADLTCPFCGNFVTFADGSDSGRGTGAILHGLPMCSDFIRMTGADFLKACLMKGGARGN